MPHDQYLPYFCGKTLVRVHFFFLCPTAYRITCVQPAFRIFGTLSWPPIRDGCMRQRYRHGWITQSPSDGTFGPGITLSYVDARLNLVKTM